MALVRNICRFNSESGICGKTPAGEFNSTPLCEDHLKFVGDSVAKATEARKINLNGARPSLEHLAVIATELEMFGHVFIEGAGTTEWPGWCALIIGVQSQKSIALATRLELLEELWAVEKAMDRDYVKVTAVIAIKEKLYQLERTSEAKVT